MDTADSKTEIKVYKFKEYILKPGSFELIKNDAKVEIEPKLFNILFIFLQSPSQVITKEQLFKDVWDDRVVTPNAISRAIYELRKILDGNDSEESCIKTIRGRGFQFNCDVEIINAPQRRQGNVLILIAAMAVFTIVFGYWYLNRVEKPPPESVPQLEKFVILPIQPITSDKQLPGLSNSILDYLSIQLQSSLNIKLVHPDNFSDLEFPVVDLWKVQARTNATYILEGSLSTPDKNILRLNLVLHKLTDNNSLEPFSLGQFDFPWPDNEEHLAQFYHERKVTIREIVKLIKPNNLVKISEHIKTSDPEAFRLTLASEHIIKNGGCDDIERAKSLLKRAITLDPDYSYAWHKLMGAHLRNVWICGSSYKDYEEGLIAANKVESLTPGLYGSAALAKNMFLIEGNLVEEAFEMNQNADMNNPDAIFRKVTNLKYAGFLHEAEKHVQRILQLDPYFYSLKPIKQAPNTIFYLNQFDKHLSLLASPGNQYHDYYRALNLFLTHRTEPAKIILEQTTSSKNKGVYVNLSMILLFIINDDNQSALSLLNNLVELRSANQQSDGEMSYKISQLYVLSGDKQSALEQLEITLKQGFFPANYWLSDPAMANIRNTAEFLRLTDSARQRHQNFAKRFGLNSEF